MGALQKTKKKPNRNKKDQRFLYECRAIGAVICNGRYISPNFIMSKYFFMLFGC